MAELALKVGAGSGYGDGDIIAAFNRRAIQCVHAQRICHVRTAQRNGSGLILPTSLAREWFEATHEFRFERVSRSEIERVTLADGARERIGPTPNERGECIDVAQFLARRKRLPDHRLFGTDGAEFWYGGAVDTSQTAVDRVWTAIESKTVHRRADFTLWPAGTQDLKSHLFLPVEDFDDTTAADYERPAFAPSGRTLSKRRFRVNWRDLFPMNIPPMTRIRDVEDMALVVDVRRRQSGPLSRTQIVAAK